MRRLAAFSLFVFLAASTSQGQTRERVTVSLVEVPVYLETLTGKPLPNLTKDDFELFINGKRQEIASLEQVDTVETPTAEPAATGQRPLRQRRLVVLLFDTWNSSFQGIKRGKEAAAKLVQEARPGDTFAVARISRGGVEFVVPFTQDKIALSRAVLTLSASSARDPFRLATMQQERVAYTGITASQNQGGGEFGGDIWKDMGVRAYQQSLSAIWAEQMDEFQDASGSDQAAIERAKMMEHLSLLAERLAPLSGVKNVVLLSEMLSPEASREGQALRIRMEQQRFAKQLHEHFRGAGVILDAVDLGGLRAPWGTRTDFNLPETLHDMTAGTGGTATYSLNALRERQRSAYVLTFQPHGAQQATNKIVVKAKNVPFGTIVRHRMAYSSHALPAPALTDGLFLADVVMNDIPQNGVSMNLKAMPSGNNTAIAVEIPGVELLAHAEGDSQLLLDAFFYIFDQQNLVVAWAYDRLKLDVDKGRDFLLANAYPILKEFDLDPGRYSAKTLVRISGTDLAGFRRLNLDVRKAEQAPRAPAPAGEAKGF